MLFSHTTEFKDINSMWSSVKQLITESINKHVPTKRTLARHSHPWMNTRLHRLCKQKRRFALSFLYLFQSFVAFVRLAFV
jgi:hypothetical protein